jgi:glycosyltransferase involved in cell wall biosynthesis
VEERNSARSAMGIGEEQFVIVSVGNCNKVKNHDALLRAFAMLPNDIHALYAHIGREEEGSAERTLTAELGIKDKVRFLGSQADPLPFLWAADGFAMPSLNEGLPISAIEAVAAGVPLVCSYVDGLSDVVAETEWSILTTTTPDSIARGLVRLSNMAPSERRKRALSDSERIRQSFSTERGVRSIAEGLYA